MRSTTKAALAFALLALLALACESGIYTGPPTPTPLSPAGGDGNAPSDWYTVYFTDPKSPEAESLRGHLPLLLHY